MTKQKAENENVLSLSERRRLSSEAKGRGPNEVCKALGITRSSLNHALAGFAVRRGTLALLRAGLATLTAPAAGEGGAP
jgi:3-methyladenine DNA glycosylase Mpg